LLAAVSAQTGVTYKKKSRYYCAHGSASDFNNGADVLSLTAHMKWNDFSSSYGDCDSGIDAAGCKNLCSGLESCKAYATNGCCCCQLFDSDTCPKYNGGFFNSVFDSYIKQSPEPATGEPTMATGEPTEATGEPTEATGEPTEATEEPTEATGEPTEATGEPTETTEDPNSHCCQGKYHGNEQLACYVENRNGACSGWADVDGKTRECGLTPAFDKFVCREVGRFCTDCRATTQKPTEATVESTEAAPEEPATINVYRVRGSYCTETVGCATWINAVVAPRDGVNAGTCAEQGYETYCSEKTRSASSCDEDGVETKFSKQKSLCDPSMETKTLRLWDAEYPEVCEETTITDCLYKYEGYIEDGWVEGSCAELDINIACPEQTHTSEERCTRGRGRGNDVKMMMTEVTYVNEEGRFYCDSLTKDPVVLVKEDAVCKGESALFQGGTVDSAAACAETVAKFTDQVNFYKFGKNENAGECWIVVTESEDCPEGFEDNNNYDFYKKNPDYVKAEFVVQDAIWTENDPAVMLFAAVGLLGMVVAVGKQMSKLWKSEYEPVMGSTTYVQHGSTSVDEL